MLTRDDLRRLRRKLKMDQASFARHVGVSEAAVSRWENGQRTVSKLAEKVICQALAEATSKAQRRVPVAAKR